MQPPPSPPPPPSLPSPQQLGYYAALAGGKGFSEVGRAGSVLFRPLGGFEAGAAALLVAVKQLIPDNEVALLGGALRFRAKVRVAPSEGGAQAGWAGGRRQAGVWRRAAGQLTAAAGIAACKRIRAWSC